MKNLRYIVFGQQNMLTADLMNAPKIRFSESENRYDRKLPVHCIYGVVITSFHRPYLNLIFKSVIKVRYTRSAITVAWFHLKIELIYHKTGKLVTSTRYTNKQYRGARHLIYAMCDVTPVRTTKLFGLLLARFYLSKQRQFYSCKCNFV